MTALDRRLKWPPALAIWRNELVRQVVRFSAIGIVSTGFTALTYSLLRIWWPVLIANLAAQVITTVLNTEANRRWTFLTEARRPITSYGRAQLGGALIFALYFAFTSAALMLLHFFVASPSALDDVVVLLLSSLVATVGRFFLLRLWTFAHQRG
jgi:putative flippase GtrA